MPKEANLDPPDAAGLQHLSSPAKDDGFCSLAPGRPQRCCEVCWANNILYI